VRGDRFGKDERWKRKAEMIEGRNREYEEEKGKKAAEKDWVREKGDE
jgi:hypothetical protein